jgi:cell division protease FtsH
MKIREALLWFVLVALVVVLAWMISGPGRQAASGPRVDFSEFMSRVDAGRVASVRIQDQDIVATSKTNETFVTLAPRDSSAFLPKLVERGVQVSIVSSSHGATMQLFLLYTSTVLPWFTLLLVVLAWLRLRALEKTIAALQGQEPPDESQGRWAR